jgi:hypothetical protein
MVKQTERLEKALEGLTYENSWDSVSGRMMVEQALALSRIADLLEPLNLEKISLSLKDAKRLAEL